MNATATRRPIAPQPLVSVWARIAAALAIAAVFALAVLGAERASEHAVDTASAAFARGATHVTLPAVQVVGRRDASGVKRI